MYRRTFLRSLPLAATILWDRSPLRAQASISVTQLGKGLHLLSGVGGNIAILESPEGLLLIDSGLPNTVAALLAETGKVGTGRVARLINTHWHYDHVGANADLGRQGAKILAHSNVRARLASKQTIAFLNRSFDPLPAEGLPVEIFTTEGRLSHGGEKVHYKHLPPAHTDGDTVIHFGNANVFHGGDLLFNGLYPFIDYSSGGSLAGMAANAERIWKLVDNRTKIIPGHGPVAAKGEIKAYADMLADCRDIMARLIKEGKSLEQIQAARPFAKHDEKWGMQFIKPEQWIAMNYAGMTMKADKAA